MSDVDRIRYENEMTMLKTKGYFTDKDGIKSNDFNKRVPKFKEHVNLPKKARTSYLYYVKAQFSVIQEQLKKKNPETKMLEVTAVLSDQWNNKLSDKEKKVYDLLASKDHKRYEAQIKELLSRGYFMTEDNVKSCDVKKKIKKAKKKDEEHAKENKLPKIGMKRSKPTNDVATNEPVKKKHTKKS